MRVALTALLSLLAFVVVVAIGGGQISRSFTMHIVSRIPATELGCFQSGEVRTDEGHRLKFFSVLPSQAHWPRMSELVA